MAEVVWRKDRQCGLRLLSGHALAGLVPASMHRAKQAWTEAVGGAAAAKPSAFGRLKPD